jgi:hypothetical protein
MSVDTPVRPSTDELRRLLDLADELQDSYEVSLRRRLLTRLAPLAIVVPVAVGLAVLGSTAKSSTTGLAGSLGIAVVFFASAVYTRVTLQQPLSRRVARDRKALNEVIRLLHEVEGPIAREEGWSALERAEFRIRLSRFSIDDDDY